MAAGPVHQEISNVPGINKHTNGVLEKPLPTVHLPPRTNTSATSSTYHKPAEVAPVIPAITTTTPVEVVETDKLVPTKEENRAKRKEDWSALEQARKLKQEAEVIKQQASQFEQVKNSPQKLDALAKVLGISKHDLMLQLQNEQLAIPNEKVLTPAEQQVAEAKAYKERLEAHEAKLNEIQFMTVKNSHINKAILPVLIKQPEDFEFCHKYGVDRVASEVYDYCNTQYQQGNRLNEAEVLQEFENALFEEWKNNLDSGKGLKKTKQYFQDKEEATPEATESLGATVQNLKEGKQLVQQASQAATDPTAKRIGKKAPLPNNVDLNNLSKNNKLGKSEPTQGVNYDKTARKRALMGI